MAAARAHRTVLGQPSAWSNRSQSLYYILQQTAFSSKSNTKNSLTAAPGLSRVHRVFDDSEKPQKVTYGEYVAPEEVTTGIMGWMRSWKGISVDKYTFLQQRIDLRPKTILRWWRNKQLSHEVREQLANMAHYRQVGPELSGAYLILALGGAVKFSKQPRWMRKDQDGQIHLPVTPVPGLSIEAIDASGTPLMYEGLTSLGNLRNLQWLNLKDCQHIDDWCLDRISGQFRHTLVHLDISNCKGVTERGLQVLSRIKCLRTLNVEGLAQVKDKELVCLLLEEALPQCTILGINYMKDIIQSPGVDQTANEEPKTSVETK